MLTSRSTGRRARGPGYAVILFLTMFAAADVASATPVMLEAGVTSPIPPIHETDVIVLRAMTPDVVFRVGGSDVESTITFLGNFEIGWQITSNKNDAGGTLAFYPLIATAQLAPLPAGTWHVTVHWQDAGALLIDPAVNSGTGAFSFEVVPEPGSLALLAAGCAVLACCARRAHG